MFYSHKNINSATASGTRNSHKKRKVSLLYQPKIKTEPTQPEIKYVTNLNGTSDQFLLSSSQLQPQQVILYSTCK